MLGKIHPVRANVGHGARYTPSRRVQAPAPIGIEQKPVLQVTPANSVHFANLPRGHQGARLLHLGKATMVEIDCHRHAARLRQVDQVGSLGAVHGEWLL